MVMQELPALRTEINRKIVQWKALTRVKLANTEFVDCGQMIDHRPPPDFPEAVLCAKDARKRRNSFNGAKNHI